MADLIKTYPKHRNAKLILAGSVRNQADENRVKQLRHLAKTLQIQASCCIFDLDFYSLEWQDNVQFVINAPYSELLEYFGSASIGLSTMVDEHFGISVVELMVSVFLLLKRFSDIRI